MPPAPRELVLVKLGGSLITDKRRPRTARPRVIRRLAEEIASVPGAGPMIVSHGSGSFGHHAAATHGIAQGARTRRQIAGVSATQSEAHALHRMVMAALLDAGVRAFSIAPSSCIVSTAGKPSRVFVDPVRAALDLGLVPVVFGDVVMDLSQGAAICSTESALGALVRRLVRHGWHARRALWMGDTAGVYDGDGRTVPRLDATTWRALSAHVGGAAATDVTGGIAHRVTSALALARRGTTSFILDGSRAGELTRGLRGRRGHGTEIPASPLSSDRGHR